MLACHAERCAALDALAESQRKTEAHWDRRMAELKQFMEPKRG
jgi:hypothetical protein